MDVDCSRKALHAYEPAPKQWYTKSMFLTGLILVIVLALVAALIWWVLREDVTSGSASCSVKFNTEKEPKQEQPQQKTKVEEEGDVGTSSASASLITVTSAPDGTFRGPIVEPTVTPMEKPRWKLFHSEQISYSLSPSFGASLSRLDEDHFVVGAPQDENYGQILVFYVEDQEQKVSLIHQNIFSTVGTMFQHAGKYLSGPLIAAPDFRQTPNPMENTLGAIFMMSNYGRDQELAVKRLGILNQRDGYYLCKTGQIMYYNHPYLYVNEELNGVTRRISVYYFDGSDKLVLEQNVLSPLKMNRFGYNIAVSSDDTCMVISDPQNDELYVYLRNDIREVWVRVQIMNNVFSVDPFKGANDATLALTEEGDLLVVASQQDQQVHVYEWSYSRFELIQDLIPTSEIPGFGQDLVLSPSGAQLFVVTDEQLQLYEWKAREHRYVWQGSIPKTETGKMKYTLLQDHLLVGVKSSEGEDQPGALQVWFQE